MIKEAIKIPRKPTPDEVERGLARIEEATLEEEMERRMRGKTQEPEGVRMPRGQEAEYLRAKEAEKGKNIPDFIREWQEENENYILCNDDVSEGKIVNKTDVKFPIEFVDYLISNARRTLKEKGLDVLGEIAAIKVKDISEQLGVIIIVIRDKADAITFLDFHSLPPFELKRSNSSLVGVNTF